MANWISISNSMICSDIWHKYHEWYFKLLYVIEWAIRRVKFETILKYQKWHLRQISHTNHAIICLTTTLKSFVIFTCRYLKLSWNTTALSQSTAKISHIVVVSNVMDKIHGNGLGSLIKVTLKVNEEKEMVTRRRIHHKRNL